MKKFMEAVLIIVTTTLMIGTFVVLMAEWASGCGETYTDAKGVRHAYECMFLPTPVLREEAKNR